MNLPPATDYPTSDPRYHTARVKAALGDVEQHLRTGAGKLSDPKARALFETAAEVLQGLHRAFDHYETGVEPAWQATAATVADALKTTTEQKPQT